jgi:hypothetical protein
MFQNMTESFVYLCITTPAFFVGKIAGIADASDRETMFNVSNTGLVDTEPSD